MRKTNRARIAAPEDGATIVEIANATDWLNHSIRGLISGTVSKKMGLAVESSKPEVNERN